MFLIKDQVPWHFEEQILRRWSSWMVDMKQTTWHIILNDSCTPDDGNCNIHHCKNCKPHQTLK